MPVLRRSREFSDLLFLSQRPMEQRAILPCRFQASRFFRKFNQSSKRDITSDHPAAQLAKRRS